VIGFGALAFVLFLAPALAVPGTLVLDHRLVLPAVGVLVVLGELVRALGPERRMLVAFGGVGMVALTLVTVGFEGAFRDPGAFAREAVASSPRSPLAHFCLGQVEQRAGTTIGRSPSTRWRSRSGRPRSCTTTSRSSP